MASSLKKEIKKLGIHNKKHRDFDPEDDPFSRGGQDSDSDETSDKEKEDGGREHYESVGKSKLREPRKLELDDKRYGGQVVSRSTLNNDEANEHDPFAPVDDGDDEDPFAIRDGDMNDRNDEELEVDDIDAADIDGDDDEDDEIDSDDAFEEGEEEIFKKKGFVFRGSGKDTRQAIVNGEEDVLEDVDEDEEMKGLSASDDSIEGSEPDLNIDMDDLSDGDEDEEVSDDEEEPSAKPRPKSLVSASSTEREKLKNLISSDTAAIATSLSQAASSDTRKGKAVKQQCQTFDRLLDARIKLQKGLTNANDLDLSTISDEEAKSALQNAEEAALRLYTTIESLRHSILETNPSNPINKKRKRLTPATTSTSTSELWSHLTELESQSLSTRRTTLDKWSTKTRSTTPISTSKLDSSHSQTQTKLTTILDTYLLSETPKLLSQSTSTTPSHPPPQSTSPLPTSNLTYNDTNFYQSLLRDLITSRSRTSTSSTTTNLPSSLPLKLHTSGNTLKKDTKASKGRKIRYTVHEKLENFMAGTGNPGEWSDAAVREFFGSLMGGSGMLDERVGDDEDGDGEGGEEEALRLFRS